MTPIDKLYLSAFIIIGLELILMVFIFMLQPGQRSNRLFAGYMLALAASSYAILVASTAASIDTIYNATRIHAMATMIAGPLLWLLILHTFAPRVRYVRWVSPFFFILAALPLLLGLINLVARVSIFFEFDSALYANGYVPISLALNGRLGGIFYVIYIMLLNSFLVIPIAYFTFSRKLPERLRRAAGILLLLSLSVALLYLPWFNIPLALRSMLTPIFAALGAAWVVSSYRFFSPVELAMEQVVDTVTIGLMVFDEQLYLMDANAFAAKLLTVDLAHDKQKLTLPMMLQRMLPMAENQAELLQLQAAIQLKSEDYYQQEIVLKGNKAQKSWIALNIRPVYDTNQLYIGSSCTIEDLTVERRTQLYITETHRALEQYAYQQALLNEITQAAIGAFNFDTDLSTLAGRLVEVFEADNCFIDLWDDKKQMLRPRVAYGVDEELYLSIEPQLGEPSISHEVCIRRQAISVEDVLQSPYISSRIAHLFPTRSMLALPMAADTKSVGALLIGFNQPRVFALEEVKWGEQVARQLTLAISKSLLLAAEREQRVLLEALQAAGQAIASTLDFEKVMDRILEEIARVVPYDTVNLALVRNGEAHVVRHRDFEKISKNQSAIDAIDRLSIADMPTLQLMWETKRPLLISNTTISPLWTDLVDHVQSWLGVPLLVHDEPIAFLMVDKIEADFYQSEHEAWLTAFAGQATLALQHAQLFTELQRRVTELEALSRVSAALRSFETVPKILQAVLQAMVEVLSARVGVAFLINEEKTAVSSQASYPSDFYPTGIHYALGEGITGYVAQTEQMYIVTDLKRNPRRQYKPQEPEAIDELCSAIALPLISKDGILGVIHLGLDTFYEFVDDEIHTLKAMCNIVANGLQRIQVMQTLEARVASRTYELETANEQLHELDKLKTKFIADVSHELRTPVANLSIYVDLLQHGKTEKWEHYVSVLRQQASRLTNLVEATLGISQLSIGQEELQVEPLSFNTIVEEVIMGHQARADRFGLRLELVLEPDLPKVLGNKIQMAQLITNLVTNAINYNRMGGEILVETTLLADEAMIRLRVTDDGIGIDENDLPHLFDRFYRGQQAGQSNIPGTGLGLAIVEEIVTLHQGKIDVESRLNEGTSVSVLLPIYQAAEPKAAVSAEEAVILPPNNQTLELKLRGQKE